MIVTLEPSEIDFVKQRATTRREIKLACKAKNFRYDTNRDDIEIMALGIAAKLAVSKLLKVDADWKDYPGSDNGYDMMLGSKTIRTKYTNYTDLSLNSLDRFTSDIVVLCRGNLPNIEITGWTDRDNFRNHHTIRNWGYGDRCVLRPSWLTDINQLMR